MSYTLTILWYERRRFLPAVAFSAMLVALQCGLRLAEPGTVVVDEPEMGRLGVHGAGDATGLAVLAAHRAGRPAALLTRALPPRATSICRLI
jgi:hypothetical protein